jgi:hypothetical protein
VCGLGVRPLCLAMVLRGWVLSSWPDAGLRIFDEIGKGFSAFLGAKEYEGGLHAGFSLCTSQSESDMPIVDRVDTFPFYKAEMFQRPGGKGSLQNIPFDGFALGYALKMKRILFF